MVQDLYKNSSVFNMTAEELKNYNIFDAKEVNIDVRINENISEEAINEQKDIEQYIRKIKVSK